MFYTLCWRCLSLLKFKHKLQVLLPGLDAVRLARKRNSSSNATKWSYLCNKGFPVSAVSGHAAPRTTPLLHIHHPAHAVLGDTRTDRHNPASVSKRTPASPSTARTLRNDLCPSASPQQSARGFSTSFPTAADAEQELCLAPVPGEQARTSVPGKLWMSSKVRQSSPVRAPLGTGAGKPILAKPFPPWNTWISRNGRPDPLLLYKI